MSRKSEVEQELSDLLVEKTSSYYEFDQWLRGDDPENVAYLHELVQSLEGARVLTRSECEHRLERMWWQVARDVAEEYAQAAAWDYERGFTSYSDRRGF